MSKITSSDVVFATGRIYYRGVYTFFVNSEGLFSLLLARVVLRVIRFLDYFFLPYFGLTKQISPNRNR